MALLNTLNMCVFVGCLGSEQYSVIFMTVSMHNKFPISPTVKFMGRDRIYLKMMMRVESVAHGPCDACNSDSRGGGKDNSFATVVYQWRISSWHHPPFTFQQHSLGLRLLFSAQDDSKRKHRKCDPEA